MGGVGLFKIFVAWQDTKENVFQKGYALLFDHFRDDFQQMLLGTISRHTVNYPELIFSLDKINQQNTIQKRALLLTREGIKNFRDSGQCSSTTNWLSIQSAIDKLDGTVHITTENKKRIYKTEPNEFLAKCLNAYYHRIQASYRRMQKFRS